MHLKARGGQRIGVERSTEGRQEEGAGQHGSEELVVISMASVRAPVHTRYIQAICLSVRLRLPV